MNKLIISNLSKSYAKGVKALDQISLTIPTGLFGLLGPNGAGKSTLMRTIATLQEPDEGAIHLGDLDVLKQRNQVRKVLGYLPQEFGVYPKISAEELLNHLAVLKGLTNKKERQAQVAALLHKTNLYPKRKKNLGTYSGGMKQRFGIAQALLSNPKLLIVDEPTAGLDPAERNRFHNLLCELGEQTIIILSTHMVEDVKELCSNMAIINQGKLLQQGNPRQLLEDLKGKVFQKEIERRERSDYQQNYRVIAEKLLLGKLRIHVFSEASPGRGFVPVEADLNDLYFTEILR